MDALIFMQVRSEDMPDIYTSYDCKTCKGQLVLLTEEVNNMSKDRYLKCPYCSSRHIKKQNISDSLKECMKESSYRRVHGKMRQVK
jgi:DNA-directed RNA polymerase subunit RPC12/RpoP